PDIAYAIDGLKFGGLHMDEAYKAGIQVAVTAPQSEHVIQGVSVAFLTGAENALVTKGDIIKDKIGILRTALEKGVADLASPNDEFTLDARGKIPLVIEVDNGDEIIRIIQLKRELEHKGTNIKFVLLGAIEAWTVAEYLAEAEVGVILKPYLFTPVQWTAQKCLPGAPLSNETGLSHLHKAGVKVGLAALESEDKEAVGLVSWDLADIVSLPNTPAGLVIYNGDPFEFGAKVSAIVRGGKTGIQCNPRAF
ncbi:hypothetical protein CPB97_004168, partial [Podila verticillata]